VQDENAADVDIIIPETATTMMMIMRPKRSGTGKRKGIPKRRVVVVVVVVGGGGGEEETMDNLTVVLIFYLRESFRQEGLDETVDVCGMVTVCAIFSTGRQGSVNK